MTDAANPVCEDVEEGDWIRPGAEVVVHSLGGAGISPSVRLGTIKRVNKKTFTVDCEGDTRFPLEKGPFGWAVKVGGTWGHWRIVVSRDSDEGKKAELGMHYRNAMRQADDAIAQWQKTRSEKDRSLVIVALDVAGSWRRKVKPWEPGSPR